MNHNCRSALLRECLKQRILILDGAMGTMLQSFHPEEADFRGEILKDHPVPLKGMFACALEWLFMCDHINALGRV